MLSAKKELFTPSGGGYQISRSVRLRNSASAYFNRTPASASDRRTWTYSGWVKRGLLNTRMSLMGGYTGTTNGTLRTDITILDGAALNVGSDQMQTATDFVLQTTQLFRDPSAWYHIVVAMDTTQATSTNRVKIYVNGVQVTAFSTATYPSLNYQGGINFNNNQYINRWFDSAGGSYYGDGYLTEINFIDGQALTPSSFGETNALTGVWQPKRYTGTYGTNGFYLPFNPPSASTYAATFNGTNQTLSVPANAAFNFTGNFTVECWLNASTVTNVTNPCLWSIGGDTNGVVLIFAGGNLYGYVAGTGGYFNTPYSSYLNTWTHIAWVRSGTTNSLYINGVLQNTGTGGATISSTGGVTIGKSGSVGTVFGNLAGTVSNFRVTNTAVYTATFIPPVGPLTAITGTQYLTLQNDTIIDNSTNAFSITNNGSVATTANTTVFANAKNLAVDQSGNSNNWTTNNISFTNGATYDSMLDVPTLYADGGNGRGNYCTLNPLQAGVAPSDGNLKITGATAHRNVLSTQYLPASGLFYFEGFAPAIQRISFGLATSAFSLTTDAGSSSVFIGCYGDSSLLRVWDRGTNIFSLSSVAANDVFQIAIDCATGKAWFGRNNTWYNSTGATTGNPSAGTNQTFTITNPTDYAAELGVYDASSNSYINFGQRPFTYTPPTGFKALNTQNLPTPTISNGATVMAATLYTGNGSTQSLTNTVNGISFQPDLVWVKARSLAYSNYLYDSVRGTGTSKSLISDATAAEGAGSANANLTSFDASGFSLGTTSGVNGMNANAGTFVGWQWKKGATQGFDIVTYTGNGTSQNISHSLGVAPRLMIVKNRATVSNWCVWHGSFVTASNTDYLFLQTTGAKGGSGSLNFWNNTPPTDSVFTVGSDSNTNNSGQSNVAYLFAEVAGYSKFGSYTGNSSADGTFVYLGFRPRWIMIKNITIGTAGQSDWVIYDTTRGTSNVVPMYLLANLANAEATSGGNEYIDILSNGFKLRGSSNYINSSSYTYIYAAFAENPFKHSLAR